MRKQGQQLLTATGVSDRYLMQSGQFFNYIIGRSIGDVMVCMLVLIAVECGFKPMIIKIIYAASPLSK
jgi:hypothetical protein